MEKLRIGFWGGCFNPPTNIHINLAKDLLKKGIIDKIVFVPVGDYYKKPNLSSAKDRYNMLKIYCNSYENLEVENIASTHKEMLYAIDTFKLIYNKYRNSEIYFIMGSDNFIKMPTWKNYDESIENYKYIVIERLNYEKKCNLKNVIYYRPEHLTNISSTQIREMIKSNKDVERLLDKDVIKYINTNNLYQDI